jgi:hypothetical protein
MKQFNIYVLLILIFPLMAFSCNKVKENEDQILIITDYRWKLDVIESEGKQLTLTKEEYFREDAFILKFDNDSVFTLNTSVNFAKGKFSIDLEAKKIMISNYHELTEVAASDMNEQSLNDLLISSMNNVNSFEQTNEILTLKGDFGVVIFEKL